MKKKINISEIVNTAIFIADQQGLDNVTLKNIANELNVKPPSLYNHIKNFDDILLRSANKSLNNLYESLIKSIIGLEKDQALLALSNEYRTFFKSYPGQYSLIQRVNLWNKNKFSTSKSDRILKLLEKILSRYDIKDTETINFIRVWRSYMHGFLLLETNNGFGLDLDVNGSFIYGLEILITKLQN